MSWIFSSSHSELRPSSAFIFIWTINPSNWNWQKINGVGKWIRVAWFSPIHWLFTTGASRHQASWQPKASPPKKALTVTWGSLSGLRIYFNPRKYNGKISRSVEKWIKGKSCLSLSFLRSQEKGLPIYSFAEIFYHLPLVQIIFSDQLQKFCSSHFFWFCHLCVYSRQET